MGINDIHSKTSFGARKILPIKVQVRRGKNETTSAIGHFSEIQQSNEDDVKIMLQILRKWKGKHSYDDFAREIAANFLHKNNSNVRYYGVALDKKNTDSYGNFCSLIQTTNPASADKSCFSIHYIQSAPKIIHPREGKSPIAGAGANAIAGAVSLAQKHGFEKVEILSCNNGFYKKLGFDKIPARESGVKACYGTVFRLPAEKFEEFISRIRAKYSSET